MPLWYYVQPKSSEKCGPLADDAIRDLFFSGALPSNALVWREGFADWIPASDAFLVAGASSAAPSAPLPEGLCGWMRFLALVLLVFAVLFCWCLWPIALFPAAAALFRAASAFDALPAVPPSLLPALRHLAAALAATGWAVILFLVILCIFFLAAAAAALAP